MSKKARRNQRSEAARHPSVARYRPAASRVWPDLLSSRPRAEAVASVARRANRRLATEAPRRGPIRPSGAVSFGAWHLPPLRDVFASSMPLVQQAKLCARRRIRREFLFAVRATGAGSHGRRLHFTNRSC